MRKRKLVKGTLVEDITGLKSGKLIAIKFDKIKNKKTFWICKCECGNFHTVSSGHLKNKDIKSCGHCEKIKINERRIIDLSGQVFGKLKIIKFNSIIKKRTFWLVKCECGREVLADAGELKRGNKKSCGLCGNFVIGTKAKDLSGEKFGKLKVESFNRIENEHTYFNCLCDCGNKCVIDSDRLKNKRKINCGHCYRKRIDGTLIQDLTGETHGFLKVTGFDRRENGSSYFYCICVCGNKVSVPSASLKSGHTISCGCLNESWLASELKKYYIDNYGAEKEHRIILNKKTRKWLKCDIYIPSQNIFIEINGSQHYKFIEFFHKTKKQFEYQKKLYNIKRKEMKKSGFLIEIDMRKINNFDDALDYISQFLI